MKQQPTDINSLIAANRPQRADTPTTTNSSNSLPVSSSANSARTTAIVSRFGTREQFLKRVNPDTQANFALQPVAAVMGDYPTLDELRTAYGKQFAAAWLVPQIYDMSAFTGARNLKEKQQEQLADILAVEARELKVTEMMLFFYRFKTGRYGRFYGSVDPMVVTTALQDFLRERQEIIDGETDRRAGEWDAEARRRWTECEREICKMAGIADGSIGLYYSYPHIHKLTVSVENVETRDAISAAIDNIAAIARRYLGTDITITAHETFVDMDRMRRKESENWTICSPTDPPPVPYAAVPPQPHPQETAPISPRKPPSG